MQVRKKTVSIFTSGDIRFNTVSFQHTRRKWIHAALPLPFQILVFCKQLSPREAGGFFTSAYFFFVFLTYMHHAQSHTVLMGIKLTIP